MPERSFPSFPPHQATQLAAEHDRVERIIHLWWKRLVVIFIILFIGMATSTGFALYKVQRASDHADKSQALAIAVNRRLIADANQRAADSRQAAAVSARTAYAACRRQQETVLVNREFYALLKPVLLFHNDPAKVRKLFHDVKAQHTFDLPQCTKPPEGSG